MPKGLLSVLAGAVTVYFSLTGAEITTIAAAESQEPARAVARMSSSVIVRILTFYVGSVLLIVTVVPWVRSEEHTSELQSQSNLVCRLLLEKKKKIIINV